MPSFIIVKKKGDLKMSEQEYFNVADIFGENVFKMKKDAKEIDRIWEANNAEQTFSVKMYSMTQ